MKEFEKWLEPILEGNKRQEWQKWQETAKEEFEEWVEDAREEWIQEEMDKEDGSWTDWDERQFMKWVLKEREKDEEKQWEKFEDWFENHYGDYSDWREKMHELYEEEKGLIENEEEHD